jgi:hypothetical protein
MILIATMRPWFRHRHIQAQGRVARPFLIKGDRRRVGVVLAHGYMAAPAEVRGLG